MIKKNQIILYIFHFLLVVLIVIAYNFTNHYLRMFTASHYTVNISLFILKEVIVMLFGISLGLGYILQEIKKDGQWGFNIPKLLILVLPCLVIYLIRLLFVSKFFVSLPNFFLPYAEYLDSGLPIFLQTFIGYSLITSFKKRETVY